MPYEGLKNRWGPDLDRQSEFNITLPLLNLISAEIEKASDLRKYLRYEPNYAPYYLDAIENCFGLMSSLMSVKKQTDILTRLDSARHEVQKELIIIRKSEPTAGEEVQYRRTINYGLYKSLRAFFHELMTTLGEHRLGLKSEIARGKESKKSRFSRGLGSGR